MKKNLDPHLSVATAKIMSWDCCQCSYSALSWTFVVKISIWDPINSCHNGCTNGAKTFKEIIKLNGTVVKSACHVK